MRLVPNRCWATHHTEGRPVCGANPTLQKRINASKWLGLIVLAEREGFEPSIQVLARITV